MIHKQQVAGFLSIVFIPIWLFGQQGKDDGPAPKYQEFLKLTHYIILPQEEEVFLKLSSDRDRDIFINSFWKQRDPTPGTPENEYKEEHLKRFHYANEHFGRGTPREGWMTDMGRIHIILGRPISIENFEAILGLYPIRVWYYYGDQTKGLPAHFGLVFFERQGAGEFKLYDPLSDGPGSLMVHSRISAPTDYQDLYETLKELAPSLADMSLSMIVGDLPDNYYPSPRNAFLLADILESPKKNVNPVYASHFLHYRGMVSTEYMTNYIESDARVDLIRDPVLPFPFLHFAIVPTNLSLEYYGPKDQYYCHFELNVSLRKDEKVVHQYTKSFPMYFDTDNHESVKMNGVALEDSFPVAEGRYTLILLLQNTVAKEFSVYEKDIVVAGDRRPHISGPFLGYQIQTYDSSVHLPYKIGNTKLVVDPKQTFSAEDEIHILYNIMHMTERIWEAGSVEIQIRAFDGKAEQETTFLLRNYPMREVMLLSHTISAADLTPQYYELTLRLMDENGRALDAQVQNFIVSPVTRIPHPITHAKGFSLSNRYVYFYELAGQYERTEDFDKAEDLYREAFALRPDYAEGLIKYADFLFRIGRYDQLMSLSDHFQDDETIRFEYFLLKGKALMGLGRYAEAVDVFLQGNAIYDSHVGLLNSLGFCYHRIGNQEEALRALRASLRLDPDQAEVRKLIALIERNDPVQIISQRDLLTKE